MLVAAVGVALEEVQLLKIEQAQAQPSEKAPLPAGLQVILVLSVWYFGVYIALQFAQSYRQLASPGLKGRWEKILEEAVLTVDFAPMLGVLFLAMRMRAQQLAPPDGNVPAGVQFAMWICALGVVAGTLASISADFLQAPANKGGAYASLNKGGVTNVSTLLRVLGTMLQTASLVAVYVAFTVVILGLFELPAPPGSEYCKTCKWRYETPPAPAVQCTIFLCVQYFSIYLGVQLVKQYNRFMNRPRSFALRCLEYNGVPSVKLCPMLAVMFIGARMRALQMDLESPPVWAQMAFFAATYASIVQTICAVLTPMVSGEAQATYDVENNVQATAARAGIVANLLSFVRVVALIVLVGGCVVTGMSIFEMKAPYGDTPAVSPAVRSVLILMSAFLTISLTSMLAQQYSSTFLGGVRTDFQKVLDAAEPSLVFIPMMSVLFVGTRMRALQLDPEGSPQKFAQTGMEVCTWSLIAQVLAALATPFFTGELGLVHVESPVIAKSLVATRYVGLAFNAAGIAAVSYGMSSL